MKIGHMWVQYSGILSDIRVYDMQNIFQYYHWTFCNYIQCKWNEEISL